MITPLAALYDISLGIHQICGLGLILLAVAITVLSVLSRNETPVIEYGLRFKVVAYPFFTLVVLTGIYQLIHLNEKFFQLWVIGAACLGIGFMELSTAHGRRLPARSSQASSKAKNSRKPKLGRSSWAWRCW